jgi:hypothetical protein
MRSCCRPATSSSPPLIRIFSRHRCSKSSRSDWCRRCAKGAKHFSIYPLQLHDLIADARSTRELAPGRHGRQDAEIPPFSTPDGRTGDDKQRRSDPRDSVRSSAERDRPAKRKKLLMARHVNAIRSKVGATIVFEVELSAATPHQQASAAEGEHRSRHRFRNRGGTDLKSRVGLRKSRIDKRRCFDQMTIV